jgi:hypothetical protein
VVARWRCSNRHVINHVRHNHMPAWTRPKLDIGATIGRQTSRITILILKFYSRNIESSQIIYVRHSAICVRPMMASLPRNWTVFPLPACAAHASDAPRKLQRIRLRCARVPALLGFKNTGASMSSSYGCAGDHEYCRLPSRKN